MIVRSWLIIFLLAIAVIYLAIGVYLYFTQERLVYFPNFPTRAITRTPEDIGVQYEDVWITTEDGIRLHGWFIPGQSDRPVLLFCHGNAGNISHRLDAIRIFHELGVSVLIFDYRGYGQSGGSPSELGTYQDGEAVWEYLRRRGFSADQIIIYGRSLGGGIATELARRRNPAALILEATFTSIPDLGQKLYPYLPIRLFARIRYDNLKKLKGINVPVLIIHSQDDELVPIEHGKKLYAAAPEPKQFVVLRGGHDDCFLVSEDEYRRALANFLRAGLDLRS
ncbi:alpha/beta hydrolase [candidate division WOR-3 bacterium]|uniref:Alpha/beta hydrolase n=1 Tax=candidate division WOR-3 bacterium TaxID=2052148 RepID=A0A660SLD0_UNCW3|nr:MAG: alpha/beta hydrolase [candidate division WOR-3 bacterium]